MLIEFFEKTLSPNFNQINYTEQTRREDGGCDIKIHVPGIPREDLSITVDDSMMTVARAGKQSQVLKRYDIKGFDEDAIDAVLDLGILTISLRPAQNKKGKFIEIK